MVLSNSMLETVQWKWRGGDSGN